MSKHSIHLEKLEKDLKISVSWRNERVKIRAEINEMKNTYTE